MPQYVREENRPWGWFGVLFEGPDAWLKQLRVDPEQRLSLQTHEHRSEVWYINSGQMDVVVGDEQFRVQAGDMVEIPLGAMHRAIGLDGPCTFTEAAFAPDGKLSEDDIQRFEDDFGRA